MQQKGNYKLVNSPHNYRNLSQIHLDQGQQYFPHIMLRRYPFSSQQPLKRHLPRGNIQCVCRNITKTPIIYQEVMTFTSFIDYIHAPIHPWIQYHSLNNKNLQTIISISKTVLVEIQLAWGKEYLPHMTPKRYLFTMHQSLRHHLPLGAIQ